MKSPAELEALRLSLRKIPSWEIRCGPLVWYICGKTEQEAIERWLEIAYRPAGLPSKISARMAYL